MAAPGRQRQASLTHAVQGAGPIVSIEATGFRHLWSVEHLSNVGNVSFPMQFPPILFLHSELPIAPGLTLPTLTTLNVDDTRVRSCTVVPGHV